MRVDDPNMENMGALLPTPVIPPVYPDQDHLMHMQSHEMFLMDPQYGARIPEGGRALMEQHIQNHLAYLYGATETDMRSEARRVGKEGVSQGRSRGSTDK